MEIPNKDQEHQCYQAPHDATSNAALWLRICSVCAQENLATEGAETSLLSDPSIRQILTDPKLTTDRQPEMIILNEHLERPCLKEITCWICLDCK
jgi:hypothetical protein